MEFTHEKNNESILPFYKFCDKVSGLIYGCLIGEIYACAKNNTTTNPVGFWSFNTDQLLLMLKNLISVGQFSPKDYIKLLQDYKSLKGLPDIINLNPDINTFNMDNYTEEAVTHEKSLVKPVDCAFIIFNKHDKKQKQTDFNTPLIRCVLAGIFENWDMLSYQACMTTHADHRCVSAGIIYTVIVHNMLTNIKTNVIRSVTETAGVITQLKKIKKQSHINEYMRYTSEGYINNIKLASVGSGKSTAYKTMVSSMYTLNKFSQDPSKETFYNGLKDLFEEGGDTVTNCALAGALMGCELGYKKLCVDESKEIMEINEEYMLKFKEIESEFFKKMGFSRVDETMPEKCYNKEGWRPINKHN